MSVNVRVLFSFSECLASASFMVFHRLENQARFASATALASALTSHFFPQHIRPSTVAFITLLALSHCHQKKKNATFFFYLTTTILFHFLPSPLRKMPPKKPTAPGTSKSPLTPAPSKSSRQRTLTNKQQQLSKIKKFIVCPA